MITTESLQSAFSSPGNSHLVQVCENLSSQAEILTEYIREGLSNGEGIVIIARPELRKALADKMNSLGLDLDDLKAQSRIKILDANFLLSLFNFDDAIDKYSFIKYVITPVVEVKLKFGKVRTFGEMVDILWKNGHQNLAVELEGMWHDSCHENDFMHFCTYLLDSLEPAEYTDSLERICNSHNHLIPIGKVNHTGDEGILSSFELTWNNVVDKIKFSKNISSISPTV
ncbi:MEDS domain-containing protein [Nitrosomonas ureae]|uniref:DcmR-like sensory protein n=1 Tax=Nitrosomonas ureae TaxID=44577 RepID=A0A2T5I2E8_9PROT|nr:MEDS domain-containing protein [Nitrosomonas ureae]PTQ78012.1 DcmR-like sensory protein [Nitrosomonas ureae]